MTLVAALYVRADSHYHELPGVDCWDVIRDARRWPGGSPVIAHPPCRAWGRLRGMAKPREDEKELARIAVRQVRENGGVLEHPQASTLWADQGLWNDGQGFTLPVSQYWFGHRAMKATWLYIVGISPRALPAMPIVLGESSHVIATGHRKGMPGWRPSVSKKEREATPPALAEWLVAVARLTHVR